MSPRELTPQEQEARQTTIRHMKEIRPSLQTIFRFVQPYYDHMQKMGSEAYRRRLSPEDETGFNLLFEKFRQIVGEKRFYRLQKILTGKLGPDELDEVSEQISRASGEHAARILRQIHEQASAPDELDLDLLCDEHHVLIDFIMTPENPEDKLPRERKKDTEKGGVYQSRRGDFMKKIIDHRTQQRKGD